MRLALLATGSALVGLAVALGGCAETQLAAEGAKRAAASRPASGQRGLYKIGEPYQQNGIWYYPSEDYTYDETGIASWYGPDFHGKITANGEDYDMNDLTAAHRTLPMPSFVRVTNLDNGRSLVVRVNDRGPYARGRILDMSRRAAQLLGFIDVGTARVRVQIMAEESRQIAAAMQARGETITVAGANGQPVTIDTRPGEPPPVPAPRSVVASAPLAAPGQVTVAALAPPPPPPPPPMMALPMPNPTGDVRLVPPRRTQIYVQAGAFANRDNAQRLSERLSGLGRAQITTVAIGRQQLFRVRVGPVVSVEEGDRLLDQVVNAGHPEARIVVD